MGHYKDVEEAEIYDRKVANLLNAYNVPFSNIYGGEIAVDRIINDVLVKAINT